MSPSPRSSPPRRPEDEMPGVPVSHPNEDDDFDAEGIQVSSMKTAVDSTPADTERDAAAERAQPPLPPTPSVPAHSTMGPPTLPSPKSNGQSGPAKVPPSGQGSKKPSPPRTNGGQMVNDPSRQMPNSSHEVYSAARHGPEIDEDQGSPELSDQSDPEDRIENFDWTDHESRYHAKMNEFRETENEIVNEFRSLCQYFDVWARAGADQEVDRSFKRMKTQAALVQHHEDELEKTRQHYIEVVNAFKGALALLQR
ncbi:uncharacterized protein LTR77_003960 [Saxophila tyrrhenica]|uniref:Uncharacterized protein n=1 Tax=Saxophila tyrrhenica TaxID=1690608 RepID=A0AAV9PJD2_9PEZI|nr:hypothetical protein LTR77_003960 [Saxophila tyrrhenica]